MSIEGGPLQARAPRRGIRPFALLVFCTLFLSLLVAQQRKGLGRLVSPPAPVAVAVAAPAATRTDAVPSPVPQKKHQRDSAVLRGAVDAAPPDKDAPSPSPPGRMLLAVSNCNGNKFISRLVSSSWGGAGVPPWVDVVVFDDASAPKSVTTLTSELGLRLVRSSSPIGLTAQWNLAWNMFKEEGFDSVCIINNDVVIPAGALDAMRDALVGSRGMLASASPPNATRLSTFARKRAHLFDFVGPMTSVRGLSPDRAYSMYNSQRLNLHHQQLPPEMLVDDPPVNSTEAIGAAVLAASVGKPYKSTVLPVRRKGGKGGSYLLGFFLCTDARALWLEKSGRGKLFTGTTNIGQEKQLLLRGAVMGVVTNAYVAHDKGGTLSGVPLKKRNGLGICQKLGEGLERR